MISTLYDEFIAIFGSYTPVIGTDPITGATIDCINFGYIFSCIMAVVCMYGILRIIGGIFSKK